MNTKFKVGDKVRIIEAHPGSHCFHIGDIGVVIESNTPNIVTVKVNSTEQLINVEHVEPVLDETTGEQIKQYPISEQSGTQTVRLNLENMTPEFKESLILFFIEGGFDLTGSLEEIIATK
jgi:hypothetical protein